MERLGKIGALALVCVCLAGCGDMAGMFGGDQKAAPPSKGEETTRPKARPEGKRAPPKEAKTVEEFDTTTAKERKEAAEKPPANAETALGMTIASLGDVAEPGFWLKTPLVNAPAKGRVEYNGKSAQVDLIPIEGPATAGSRISLAAMRLIEAPLTGLPEIRVFKN